MDELDELIEEFEWRASMEGELGKSAFVKESRDAMEEVLNSEGLFNYCLGNAFKYIWRCKKKHKTPLEDLKKAQWYINKAIEMQEDNENGK